MSKIIKKELYQTQRDKSTYANSSFKQKKLKYKKKIKKKII